jgi:hypothetical protein
MPRFSLFTHQKFLRLCYILKEPEPHVLGYLEYLWYSAYQSGHAVIGDEVDVELAAKYPGERGKLAQALLEVRLLDRLEEGWLAVHDLADHAPESIKKRWQRDGTRKNAYSPRVRKSPELGGIGPPNSSNGLPHSSSNGQGGGAGRGLHGEAHNHTGVSPPISEIVGLTPSKAELGAIRGEGEKDILPSPPLGVVGAKSPSGGEEDLGVRAAAGEGGSGKKTKRVSSEPAGFDQFWAAYPHRVARQAAVRAFAKLAPSPELLSEILAAVARQRVAGCLVPGLTREGRSTIPYPASWLNGRRWQDELPQAASPPPEAPRSAPPPRRQLSAEERDASRAALRGQLPLAGLQDSHLLNGEVSR